jgi:glycerol-1-phosphate dehydrogenase [NAD(P)+]
MFAALHSQEVALVDALETGDTPRIVTALMQALISSGEAMAKAGSSAPASQGEHMLAHVLEMLDPSLNQRHFHGEIIAVTTLVMARLQEKLAENVVLPFSSSSFPFKRITDAFGEVIAARWQETITHKTKAVLPKEALSPVPFPVLSSATLQHVLSQAGCPTTIAEIGIDKAVLHSALQLAPFSRQRFTWLDMQHKNNAGFIP